MDAKENSFSRRTVRDPQAWGKSVPHESAGVQENQLTSKNYSPKKGLFSDKKKQRRCHDNDNSASEKTGPPGGGFGETKTPAKRLRQNNL